VAGRGLLSRIAGGGAPPDEAEAIVEHLRALLNTRAGEVPCCPGYGVMDFTDVVHGIPATLPFLVKSIRTTILENEPRLRNVSVRAVPVEGELALRFEISAQLANEKGRTLRLSTTVRPGGRYDVT
jgi:type VI secretion system protein